MTFTTTTFPEKASSGLPATQDLPIDLDAVSSPAFSGYISRLNPNNLPGGFTNTGFAPMSAFDGATGQIFRQVNGQNTFRFQYSQVGIAENVTPISFNKTLSSFFDSFYLTGTCTVCGPGALIQSQTTTAFGSATVDSSTSPAEGSYSFSSITIPITYGDTGFIGTLQYTGINSFETVDNESEQSVIAPISATGTFTLTAEPIPAPLPLAGAALAFGWSRKLRRRIADQTLA
ncbi:hypothetical protein KBY97_03505 [Synechococcus sp. ATX 2A4]|uniref:hypothetical protein n=1 Tax=Synechococcus sp. ATX 2A4 TaxID=2823727 RepID=UPI0020CEA701|nr:hypothetical protein [Synechococcus sp. ATX 2A4]MCP9884196.1 hypothetical protein [Synechococcus sp. ATX 2A4]